MGDGSVISPTSHARSGGQIIWAFEEALSLARSLSSRSACGRSFDDKGNPFRSFHSKGAGDQNHGTRLVRCAKVIFLTRLTVPPPSALPRLVRRPSRHSDGVSFRIAADPKTRILFQAISACEKKEKGWVASMTGPEHPRSRTRLIVESTRRRILAYRAWRSCTTGVLQRGRPLTMPKQFQAPRSGRGVKSAIRLFSRIIRAPRSA